MKTCWTAIKNRRFVPARGNGMPNESSSLGVARDAHRQRRGTSLIEVMLGILILTILAVSVVRGLAYPRFLAVSAAHKQAAIQAANEVLEVVLAKGYGFANARLGLDPQSLEDLDGLGDMTDRYAVNGRTISGSWTVTRVDWDTDTIPMLQISVSVDYPGGDDPVELETLVSP